MHAMITRERRASLRPPVQTTLNSLCSLKGMPLSRQGIFCFLWCRTRRSWFCFFAFLMTNEREEGFVLTPISAAPVEDLLRCAERCDSLAGATERKKLTTLNEVPVPERFWASFPAVADESEAARATRVLAAWRDLHADGQRDFICREAVVSGMEYSSFLRHIHFERKDIVGTEFRAAKANCGSAVDPIISAAARDDTVFKCINNGHSPIADLKEAVRVLRVVSV